MRKASIALLASGLISISAFGAGQDQQADKTWWKKMVVAQAGCKVSGCYGNDNGKPVQCGLPSSPGGGGGCPPAGMGCTCKLNDGRIIYGTVK